MKGGRFEVALLPLATPTSHGSEQVEFRVASHPKQPLGPLAKVASGGELSRIALAIQVVTSEVGDVPTLIFDEVDVGIGGAVAATVGRLLQSLGNRRQVLCVTHLPQVAAFADAHFRVTKPGDAEAVHAEVEALAALRGSRSSRGCWPAARSPPKTRAHAKELLEQHRRPAALARQRALDRDRRRGPVRPHQAELFRGRRGEAIVGALNGVGSTGYSTSLPRWKWMLKSTAADDSKA